VIATFLGAGQAAIAAQEIEQGGAWIALEVTKGAVDGKRHGNSLLKRQRVI
jgi:hypothetical protein